MKLPPVPDEENTLGGQPFCNPSLLLWFVCECVCVYVCACVLCVYVCCVCMCVCVCVCICMFPFICWVNGLHAY